MHSSGGLVDRLTVLATGTSRPDQRILRIVLNPHGGNGKAQHTFDTFVEPVATISGVTLDVTPTQYAGHTIKMGRNYIPGSAEGVIFISGDGAVQEFLQGLVGRPNWKEAATQLIIGHIGQGSANALARGLHTMHPLATMHAAVKCRIRPLDSMLLTAGDGQHRLSICGIGWGVPGDIAAASEEWRSCGGTKRYIWLKCLKGVLARRVHTARISYTLQGIRPVWKPQDLLASINTRNVSSSSPSSQSAASVSSLAPFPLKQHGPAGSLRYELAGRAHMHAFSLHPKPKLSLLPGEALPSSIFPPERYVLLYSGPNLPLPLPASLQGIRNLPVNVQRKLGTFKGTKARDLARKLLQEQARYERQHLPWSQRATAGTGGTGAAHGDDPESWGPPPDFFGALSLGSATTMRSQVSAVSEGGPDDEQRTPTLINYPTFDARGLLKILAPEPADAPRFGTASTALQMGGPDTQGITSQISIDTHTGRVYFSMGTKDDLSGSSASRPSALVTSGIHSGESPMHRPANPAGAAAHGSGAPLKSAMRSSPAPPAAGVGGAVPRPHAQSEGDIDKLGEEDRTALAALNNDLESAYYFLFAEGGNKDTDVMKQRTLRALQSRLGSINAIEELDDEDSRNSSELEGTGLVDEADAKRMHRSATTTPGHGHGGHYASPAQPAGHRQRSASTGPVMVRSHSADEAVAGVAGHGPSPARSTDGLYRGRLRGESDLQGGYIFNHHDDSPSDDHNGDTGTVGSTATGDMGPLVLPPSLGFVQASDPPSPGSALIMSNVHHHEDGTVTPGAVLTAHHQHHGGVTSPSTIVADLSTTVLAAGSDGGTTVEPPPVPQPTPSAGVGAGSRATSNTVPGQDLQDPPIASFPSSPVHVGEKAAAGVKRAGQRFVPWRHETSNYIAVGAVNIAADAFASHPSDGFFDLLLAREGATAIEVAGLLGRYLLGREYEHPLMDYFKASALIIQPVRRISRGCCSGWCSWASRCFGLFACKGTCCENAADNKEVEEDTFELEDLNVDGEVVSARGPFTIQHLPALMTAYGEPYRADTEEDSAWDELAAPEPQAPAAVAFGASRGNGV